MALRKAAELKQLYLSMTGIQLCRSKKHLEKLAELRAQLEAELSDASSDAASSSDRQASVPEHGERLSLCFKSTSDTRHAHEILMPHFQQTCCEVRARYAEAVPNSMSCNRGTTSLPCHAP